MTPLTTAEQEVIDYLRGGVDIYCNAVPGEPKDVFPEWISSETIESLFGRGLLRKTDRHVMNYVEIEEA